MPRAEQRPPGVGDVKIGRARHRPLAGGPRKRFVPRTVVNVVRVWGPHPVSVFSARFLGDLYGRGIAGHTGTIATEAGRNGVGKSANPATGFTGYAQPPQLFTGWNPGAQLAVGTPLRTPGGLPDTSLPGGGPLDAAMANIDAGSSFD